MNSYQQPKSAGATPIHSAGVAGSSASNSNCATPQQFHPHGQPGTPSSQVSGHAFSPQIHQSPQSIQSHHSHSQLNSGQMMAQQMGPPSVHSQFNYGNNVGVGKEEMGPPSYSSTHSADAILMGGFSNPPSTSNTNHTFNIQQNSHIKIEPQQQQQALQSPMVPVSSHSQTFQQHHQKNTLKNNSVSTYFC